jgi:hypothetical protein
MSRALRYFDYYIRLLITHLEDSFGHAAKELCN